MTRSQRAIPLIFTDFSIRGLLADTKWMTRRLEFKGQPGDLVWAKETWAPPMIIGEPIMFRATDAPLCPSKQPKWRSPLFMPKASARILRLVVTVQEQRLRDITEDDAIAEGVERETRFFDGQFYRGARKTRRLLTNESPYSLWRSPVDAFIDLFRELHGDRIVRSNPRVYRIELGRENVPWPEALKP